MYPLWLLAEVGRRDCHVDGVMTACNEYSIVYNHYEQGARNIGNQF